MYPGKPLAPALQLAQDAKEARTRELVKFAAATEAREALASQRDRHLSEHEHRVRLVEEHNHFQLLERRLSVAAESKRRAAAALAAARVRHASNSTAVPALAARYNAAVAQYDDALSAAGPSSLELPQEAVLRRRHAALAAATEEAAAAQRVYAHHNHYGCPLPLPPETPALQRPMVAAAVARMHASAAAAAAAAPPAGAPAAVPSSQRAAVDANTQHAAPLSRRPLTWDDWSDSSDDAAAITHARSRVPYQTNSRTSAAHGFVTSESALSPPQPRLNSVPRPLEFVSSPAAAVLPGGSLGYDTNGVLRARAFRTTAAAGGDAWTSAGHTVPGPVHTLSGLQARAPAQHLQQPLQYGHDPAVQTHYFNEQRLSPDERQLYSADSHRVGSTRSQRPTQWLDFDPLRAAVNDSFVESGDENNSGGDAIRDAATPTPVHRATATAYAVETATAGSPAGARPSLRTSGIASWRATTTTTPAPEPAQAARTWASLPGGTANEDVVAERVRVLTHAVLGAIEATARSVATATATPDAVRATMTSLHLSSGPAPSAVKSSGNYGDDDASPGGLKSIPQPPEIYALYLSHNGSQAAQPQWSQQHPSAADTTADPTLHAVHTGASAATSAPISVSRQRVFIAPPHRAHDVFPSTHGSKPHLQPAHASMSAQDATLLRLRSMPAALVTRPVCAVAMGHPSRDSSPEPTLTAADVAALFAADDEQAARRSAALARFADRGFAPAEVSAARRAVPQSASTTVVVADRAHTDGDDSSSNDDSLRWSPAERRARRATTAAAEARAQGREPRALESAALLRARLQCGQLNAQQQEEVAREEAADAALAEAKQSLARHEARRRIAARNAESDAAAARARAAISAVMTGTVAKEVLARSAAATGIVVVAANSRDGQTASVTETLAERTTAWPAARLERRQWAGSSSEDTVRDGDGGSAAAASPSRLAYGAAPEPDAAAQSVHGPTAVRVAGKRKGQALAARSGLYREYSAGAPPRTTVTDEETSPQLMNCSSGSLRGFRLPKHLDSPEQALMTAEKAVAERAAAARAEVYLSAGVSADTDPAKRGGSLLLSGPVKDNNAKSPYYDADAGGESLGGDARCCDHVDSEEDSGHIAGASLHIEVRLDGDGDEVSDCDDIDTHETSAVSRRVHAGLDLSPKFSQRHFPAHAFARARTLAQTEQSEQVRADVGMNQYFVSGDSDAEDDGGDDADATADGSGDAGVAGYDHPAWLDAAGDEDEDGEGYDDVYGSEFGIDDGGDAAPVYEGDDCYEHDFSAEEGDSFDLHHDGYDDAADGGENEFDANVENGSDGDDGDDVDGNEDVADRLYQAWLARLRRYGVTQGEAGRLLAAKSGSGSDKHVKDAFLASGSASEPKPERELDYRDGDEDDSVHAGWVDRLLHGRGTRSAAAAEALRPTPQHQWRPQLLRIRRRVGSRWVLMAAPRPWADGRIPPELVSFNRARKRAIDLALRAAHVRRGKGRHDCARGSSKSAADVNAAGLADARARPRNLVRAGAAVAVRELSPSRTYQALRPVWRVHGGIGEPVGKKKRTVLAAEERTRFRDRGLLPLTDPEQCTAARLLVENGRQVGVVRRN